MKQVKNNQPKIISGLPAAATVVVSERQSSVRGLIISLIVIILFAFQGANAQSQYRITEIITDFNGYWQSSASAISPVKPDNSHNLLGFTFNGTRYSTGVDDAALTAHGQTFVAGDYRALPVTSITGSPNSSTKIGVGEKYDGVSGGRGVPPINNIPFYLTDGKKGLDIGTCVANLPVSAISFGVSNLRISSINDNIPDIVITQTADPSGSSFDRYEFTDINGNRVGNSIDIVLSNIPIVGKWIADFYDASVNPMTLGSGFTKTERGFRLWTGDFGVFGIDASNISRVAYFKVTLSGDSDVAFVAYNNNAINVNLVLPTTLTSFTGKNGVNGINLGWETASESNTDKFVIEKSVDGSTFVAAGTVKAAGSSNTKLQYGFVAPSVSGTSFYRLRMVDLDGKTTYSSTISVTSALASDNTLSAYPNPGSTYTTVKHTSATGAEIIGLYTAQGILVSQVKATGTQTRIELNNQPPGVYHLLYNGAQTRQSMTLVIR